MLARSTYKLDFLFSNFGFGVLHSQKCYVMFQYRGGGYPGVPPPPGVSVQCYLRQSYGSDFSMGFIDQVAIFSDFIRLFELLGPGLTPYGSNAFYILE